MEADISLHLFLQGREWQSRDGLPCGQGNCAAARMAELFRKRAWLPPHLWPSEHQISPITGTQRPLACWPLFKGQWPFPGRSGKKASLSAREPSLSSLLRRHRQSHQPWRQQGHLSKPHLEQAGGAQGLQEGRGSRPSEAVPGLRANVHRQAVLQGQMDGGKVLLVLRVGQKGHVGVEGKDKNLLGDLQLCRLCRTGLRQALTLWTFSGGFSKGPKAFEGVL